MAAPRSAMTVIRPKPAPVRTVEVHLDGDYEGWVAVVRTNHPFGIMLDLQSGDEARVVAAAPRMFHSWNWVDEEGKPIPQPHEGGLMLADYPAIQAAVQKALELIRDGSELPKA